MTVAMGVFPASEIGNLPQTDPGVEAHILLACELAGLHP
jgi:hypothetical protein